jgi:hypothetical protein
MSEIHLDPELTEDTITHEFVHHARTVDDTRIGFAKTAYKIKDGISDENFFKKNMAEIRNFEEAATVAETTARTKAPSKNPSGYYDYVKEISRMVAYNSDRKRLTRNPQSAVIDETKGIKGKAVINIINAEFVKTHIASMKIGLHTALQSYEILINKY